jgi:hypothetical protein
MALNFYPTLATEPRYDPYEDPEDYLGRMNWKAATNDPNATSSDGLIKALQPFASGEIRTSSSIYPMLVEYMRLGATAAALWAHIWRVDGIRRGEHLRHSDSRLRLVLDTIQKHSTHIVEDCGSEFRPKHVRFALSRIHYGGEFMWLVNRVFGLVIAPRGSTIREDRFAVEFQRWIIAAATRPEVDPNGTVARVIREAGLSPESPEWTRYSRREFALVQYRDSNENNFVDVELIPYGRRIQVQDLTEQILQPPHNSTCTICLEDFGTDVDESSCRRIDGCKHMFHWGCLDGYINASHVRVVVCPNCRTPICNARKRRPKVEQDNQGPLVF